ncbi:C-reactive protein 1.4-like [Limulus polyphemus]|uniref:C-reactive protein 1.4-like n=1 Tax=Limulus polyphemus TaxID=6850 RepID=A0ABM1BEY4_LIMPO|nr:C-reactive protein 1.4-like [Limulus polyphemus]
MRVQLFYVFATTLVIVWTSTFADAARRGQPMYKFEIFGSTSTRFPRFIRENGINRNLTEFTLCMWLKVSSLVSSTEYPFSYATQRFHNELLTFLESTDDGHPSVGMFINDVSHKFAIVCPTFSLGDWHRVCYAWRSVDGFAMIVVDPDKDPCEVTMTDFAKGKMIQLGGTISLGQEQTFPGGGFTLDQSFDGEYTEVQMFSEILDTEQIFRISTCLSCEVDRSYNYEEQEIRGDIIDWMNHGFVGYDGGVISGTNVCR